jgi:hypothetical protein
MDPATLFFVLYAAAPVVFLHPDGDLPQLEKPTKKRG